MRVLSYIILVSLALSIEIYAQSPHGDLKGLDCSDCHESTNWKINSLKNKFDHSKTGFKLNGQHQSVNCISCHIELKFSNAQSNCNSCHKDIHQNTVGLDCSNCHKTDSWIISNRNELHQKSRFPLLGSHLKADCIQCHSGYSNLNFATLGINCVDCHLSNYQATQNPNHALAGFSTNCLDCHSLLQNKWSAEIFAHNFFPLTGGHNVQNCFACHQAGGNFGGLSTDCYSCHQSDYEVSLNPPHASSNFPTNCKQCHTIQGWKPASFDHNQTQFLLTGVHLNTDCASCHKNGYGAIPTSCVSCHESNFNSSTNPNHPALAIPTDCQTCHTTNPGWKPASFAIHNDYYPLIGAHAQIANDCATCHKGNYNNSPNTCYGCHQTNYANTTNPPHQTSQFPTDCLPCHSQTAWTPATFDHDNPYFPIYSGKHRDKWNACSDCHTVQSNYTVFSCIDCHEHNKTTADNQHKGVSGYVYASSECFSCHPRGTADGAFNHATSIFPLTGAHLTVDCNQCHKNGYANTPTNCYDCHLSQYNGSTNPNHSALSISTDCSSCHNTAPTWKPAQFPQHETYFVLTGAHATISNDCNRCHNGNYTNISNTCVSCHQTDYNSTQNHLTQGFPTDCEMCHNSVAWNQSTFDHNNTNFQLAGGHVGVDCSNCHKNGYTNTPTECSSCHLNNFNSTTNPSHVTLNISDQCQTCHTTNPGWKPASFAIHDNYYQLIGAHAQIANNCVSCHNGNYNSTPNTCYGCHTNDYNSTIDPPHSSSGFNNDCQSCHSQNAWKPATWDHDGQYFPIYSGKHNSKWSTCADCHTVQSNYSVFSCIDCHEHNKTTADDQHKGVSGYVYSSSECFSCHPRGTADGAFNHATSIFPLTGAHQTVDCNQCHKNGYANTPTNCYDCHQSQYNGSTNPNHTTLSLSTDCSSCHTTNAGWKPAQFPQHDTYFALTGAHQTADCSQCHNGNYTDISNTCVSCHQTAFNSAVNPNHSQAGISNACESCHNSAAWIPSTFDHSSTGFSLEGTHLSTQCSSCHKGTTAGLNNACLSCHQDDYNSAQNHVSQGFPADCQMCHNAVAWNQATFNHDNTNFQLTGAHVAVDCSTCHKNGYTNTPTECSSCHISDFNNAANPNHVSLNLSNQCQSCHTTNPGWKPATFSIHDNFFQLIGAHAAIQNNCSSCHVNGYTNTPTECYGCHQTDYTNTADPPHQTSQFPTDCLPCHNQNAWTPATFDHDNPYFPIYSGKHRGRWSKCSDCHTNQSDYKVFSCIDCHTHNKTETDSHHSGVRNYVYTSIACYDCHPNGNTLKSLQRNFQKVD